MSLTIIPCGEFEKLVEEVYQQKFNYEEDIEFPRKTHYEYCVAAPPNGAERQNIQSFKQWGLYRDLTKSLIADLCFKGKYAFGRYTIDRGLGLPTRVFPGGTMPLFEQDKHATEQALIQVLKEIAQKDLVPCLINKPPASQQGLVQVLKNIADQNVRPLPEEEKPAPQQGLLRVLKKIVQQNVVRVLKKITDASPPNE